MTGTVADLVHFVHEQTAFSKTFVEQRARNLQAGGRLRVTAGSKQPRATARDCTNLLFSLAASVARHAPHVAAEFEMLERIGECDPSDRRAGDFFERLIARLWAGDREHVRSIVTLWKHPFSQIDLTDSDRRQTRFYPPGQLVGVSGRDLVRGVIDIPCKAIAGIGADLGHKGCQYAR